MENPTFILNITKPKGLSHIFWEHALKSALAFTGTFALLFFGPLFLGGRAGKHSDNELIGEYMAYLTNHPTFSFCVSAAVVLLYNIHTIRKNLRTKCVVSIARSQTDFVFEVSNLYFSDLNTIHLPKENLSIIRERKIADNTEKTDTVMFMDTRENTLIGMIKTNHSIWENQLLEVKYALSELKKLGISITDTKKKKTNVLNSFFSNIFKR